MIAEGKVLCPWCGQAEVVQFKMRAVQYNTSHYGDKRTLQVTVDSAGVANHNCSADTPAAKPKDPGW